MKKTLLIISLLFFVSSCGDKSEQTKNFETALAKVSSVTEIISNVDGAYSYPKFDRESDKIFFSTVDYTGIFYYDMNEKSINNLIDSKGTGLNYIVKDDYVYFVLPALSERTNRRIFSVAQQNIQSKKIDVIYKSNKGIKSINIDDNYLSFFVEDSIKFFDIHNNVFVEGRDIFDVKLFSFNQDELLLYTEGELKKITPFEDYSITNVIEIDDNNLLLEVAGKGVYKYSLESNQSELLTNSLIMIDVVKNSNLAVGIKQENDGLQETNSQLFLFNLNTKELFNLTAELNITALNPSLSKDGSKIVFNTMEGDIYLMSLKISEGQAL